VEPAIYPWKLTGLEGSTLVREDVIQRLCQAIAKGRRENGDYSRPTDGFCHECPAADSGGNWNFQYDESLLAHLEATLEKAAKAFSWDEN